MNITNLLFSPIVVIVSFDHFSFILVNVDSDCPHLQVLRNSHAVNCGATNSVIVGLTGERGQMTQPMATHAILFGPEQSPPSAGLIRISVWYLSPLYLVSLIVVPCG